MITYIIGEIGSGKSVYAARIAKKALKKKIPVYSLTAIKGCYKVNIDDFMKYEIADGILLIDESGLYFNARKYKSTPDEVIKLFKLSRHYKLDIYIISQKGNDTDLQLRNLANKIIIVRPFVRIGKKLIFSTSRDVRQKLDIDEKTHQLVDMYYKTKKMKILYNLPYFKLFDSHVRDLLPKKEFDKY